ncbi:MAG: hypothetical protein OXI87_18855 [Albidovulum sp.]|nr:hypothetical protein [Albidovulum sp.]
MRSESELWMLACSAGRLSTETRFFPTPALLGRMKEADYSVYIALECIHLDYMNTLFDDVLSERIAMRDIFWQWSND